MTLIDLGSYKSIYLQTAKEYINSMFLSCTKLANNSLDKQALNNLYISSHSLKSQSQVMDFTNMANLCAIIEKTSNDILNGVAQADDGFINFLKKSVDELNLGFAKIEKGDPETLRPRSGRASSG